MQTNPFQLINTLSPLLYLTPLAPMAPVVGALSGLLSNNQNQRIVPASSSSYAMGGKLKRLSEGSLHVESNKKEMDDVITPLGRFDDGEVIWENFVFSNRILNPDSGNSFSEDAKRILSKLRTIASSKGYRDVKTVALTKQLLENLAKHQESIKQLMTQPLMSEGYSNGGPLTPSGEPLMTSIHKYKLYQLPAEPPYDLPIDTSPVTEPFLGFPTAEDTPQTLSKKKIKLLGNFTTGDKLQFLALASQAVPLLFRPTEEKYQRLNYFIPYLHHDITPYLEEGRRGLVSALRTTSNYSSPSLRALLAAGALASQGSLLDKLMESSHRTNQGALDAYSRAIGARDTANAEMFMRNQAINQANRAKYLEHLNTFATSVANLGAALNEREAAKDYLNLLKTVYKIK